MLYQLKGSEESMIVLEKKYIIIIMVYCVRCVRTHVCDGCVINLAGLQKVCYCICHFDASLKLGIQQP